MVKKVLILATLFILIPFLTEAKNLYVNNSGSPACSDATTYANNSASSPWCTLLRATWGRTDGNRSASSNPSQAAQPGDIIYVSAGTYHYSGVFNGAYPSDGLYKLANNGSVGTTIEAVGTVELTSNTSGDHAIIGGTSLGTPNAYVTWKGFTLNQANIGWRKGWGVIFIAEAYTTIENCTIIGAYHTYPHGADNHAGIMVHGPRSGACTGGLSNITIKNNRIYGFTGASGRNDAGITLYCLGSDIAIENNEIYSNTTGIYAKSSYQDTTNFNIRYNIFRSNGEGIAMQAWYDWHVVQNIFINNTMSGFTWFCSIYYAGNPAPKDTYVVNNTFHNNTQAFWLSWGCENLNDNFVRNNIFTNQSYTLVAQDAACSITANMGPDDIDFNYNLYNITSTFFVKEGGSTVASWATWRSSYGQDSNSSYGVNPLYIDPAGNDFRLQSGSPARTLGRTMTRIHGSSGVTIPAGAYITGNEVIGRISDGRPLPPVGLSIR